jgi:hypothetical protein
LGKGEKENMKTPLSRHVRALWRADLLSPKDLLRRAVFLIVLYLLIQLAGLREFTSVISGTTGSIQLSWHISAFLALTYILSYLSLVLLVPILLLAAVLLFGWEKIRGKKAQ